MAPRALLRHALSLAIVLLGPGQAQAEVRSAHVVMDRGDLSRARALGALALGQTETGTSIGIVEAPFAFTAVAALSDSGSDGSLMIRVSRDGRSWSAPTLVPDDEPNPALNERGGAHRFALDRVSALHFPKLLGDGPPRFLAFEYAGAKRSPTRLAFHFIDAGTTPERSGRLRPRGVDPTEKVDPLPHPLKPIVVSRAEWGARLPRYPYTLTLARHMAVHHTAGLGDGLAATTEQCAAQVRAIQAFHQDTRDWNDVGYSYLICGNGEIFQAREDDDDATDVWGAHDGFNRGSMSISLMGYFHPPYNQIPSQAMLDTLVRTLAWMADIRAIDPLDASLYEAFGSVRTNIYGHREVRPTDCPGNTIFAMKDLLRVAVAETLSRFREQPAEMSNRTVR
jgi:hypothetical protein